MKKFVSITLALILMLSSITAFASNDNTIINVMLKSKYLSGELDFKMSVKPNEPLPKFIDPDGTQTKLLEAMNIAYHLKYNTSEDGKKMQAELNMLATIPNMENMHMKYWVDMDLSNSEKPVFKFIMKPSENEKYMLLDYDDNRDNTVTAAAYSYTKDIIAVGDGLLSTFDMSKLKTEYKNGKYIITVDENTVKEIFKSLVTAMSKYFINYFTIANKTVVSSASSVGIIGGSDGPTTVDVISRPTPEAVKKEDLNVEAIEEQYKKAVDEIFAKLSNVQLFANDAVVIETELDDKNLIKNQKITVNIAANIAKILGVFGISDASVTKENSDLNISLIMDFAYSRINEQVIIAYPELTKDNSIDMFAELPAKPVISENKFNVLVNGQLINFDVEPVLQDGRVLVPVRAFLNSIGVEDKDIVYEDGNILIKRGNKVVNLKVGSNIAFVNGKEVVLDSPVMMKDGRTLIPVRFMAETFKFNVEWMPLYKGKADSLSGGIISISSQYPEQYVTIMVPAGFEYIDKLNKASDMAELKVNIMEASIENYKEKTFLIIAAGEPAVVYNLGIDKERMDKLIEQNAFIALDDLISKYAPNIRKFLDENTDVKSAVTNEDGHIYTLPVLKDNVQVGEFFITNTVKNPQTIIQLLDNFYTGD